MKRFAPLLLLLALGSAHADPAAQRVLECMRENVPPTVRVQDFELQVTDPKGEVATLSGKLFAQRETAGPERNFTHAVMRVNQPEHLKGAAYLVRQTDDYLRDGMYVYLPSVKRVRRVTGTFADGSLLGTTFSYYDFKQLANAFGDLEAKLESTSKIGDRAVKVLSFKSVPGAETMYSGARAWIDDKTCLPLKVEFLEKDKPRKRLTAEPAAMRPYGKRWYLSESQIVDLKDNSRTVLRIVNISDGKELPGRYFNPNTFYLGN
jgi:hypothetical protein